MNSPAVILRRGTVLIHAAGGVYRVEMRLLCRVSYIGPISLHGGPLPKGSRSGENNRPWNDSALLRAVPKIRRFYDPDFCGYVGCPTDRRKWRG